jgi:hypothetical protein
MRLEPLEAAVLEKLLDGDHPVLVGLRRQLPGLSARSRERTGGGFFTTFAVANTDLSAPIASRSSPFGDVEAAIRGLKDGAGFLLYIKQGQLHMLEGYSYGEPWPEHVDEFSLVYSSGDRATELSKLGPIFETSDRARQDGTARGVTIVLAYDLAARIAAGRAIGAARTRALVLSARIDRGDRADLHMAYAALVESLVI